jgi:hypothetical protein
VPTVHGGKSVGVGTVCCAMTYVTGAFPSGDGGASDGLLQPSQTLATVPTPIAQPRALFIRVALAQSPLPATSAGALHQVSGSGHHLREEIRFVQPIGIRVRYVGRVRSLACEGTDLAPTIPVGPLSRSARSATSGSK